jgi:hypothetical protein
MEAGLAAWEVAVFSESDAALCDDLVEVGKGVEVLDAFGDGERLGVPSGAVEHEDDDTVACGARLACEEREGGLEELLVDAGREIPEALAGCGRQLAPPRDSPLPPRPACGSVERRRQGGSACASQASGNAWSS